MPTPPVLFAGLIDDAAMFPPGNAEVADAVAAHQDYRRSWFSALLGPLVVSDQRLVEVGRALHRTQQEGGCGGEAAALAVSVVNTSGAGGLVSLAGREVPGVRVVAVESALRDLDDLAQNAVRVLSAASELDDAVDVFVEIPYAPGWERAAAQIEAAGRYGKLRTGGPEPRDTPSPEQLARQLSVLIEADLGFKATAGLHHALATAGSDAAQPRQHGFLNVLSAVAALVEGAGEADAAEQLARLDGSLVTEIGSWSDAEAARVRRRLRSFGCCGVLDPVQDLVALGLVREPT